MKRILSILLLIALVSCINTAFSASDDADVYFIICEPKSDVNVRISPDMHSAIVGTKFFGDEVIVDKEKNGFVHITNLNSEYSEGWVYKGLITEDQPTQTNSRAVIVSDARVAGRKYVNGKIIRWLNNGTEVNVFAVSEEWCVTDKGYIKTEFLKIREQEVGD